MIEVLSIDAHYTTLKCLLMIFALLARCFFHFRKAIAYCMVAMIKTTIPFIRALSNNK